MPQMPIMVENIEPRHMDSSKTKRNDGIGGDVVMDGTSNGNNSK